MNTSKLFVNAILNLYKKGIYTVDFAILKATDYADRNKITGTDYTELITYLAEEQEKEMTVAEAQETEETENIAESAETVDTEVTENTETSIEEVVE